MILVTLLLAFGLSSASDDLRCNSVEEPMPCYRLAPGEFGCPIGQGCIVQEHLGGENICCNLHNIVNNYSRPDAMPCEDTIKPSRGFNLCDHLQDHCHQPFYSTVMRKLCPETCGACSVDGDVHLAPISGCSDVNSTPYRPFNCSERQEYCNNPIWSEFMRVQCPKTCGACPTEVTINSVATPECYDLASTPESPVDCSPIVHLCHDAHFQGFMMTQCRKSCGYCTPFPPVPNTTCADSEYYQEYCTEYADQCGSPYPPAAFMRAYCPKTCGFCTPKDDLAPVSSSTCADFEYKGQKCSQFVAYCKVEEYKSFMQINCPQTCGFCAPNVEATPVPPASCADEAGMEMFCSDFTVEQHCENKSDQGLQAILRKYCSKTCGFCTSDVAVTPAPTSCADTEALAQFCSDTASQQSCKDLPHPGLEEFLKKHCRNSCGFCTPDVDGTTAPTASSNMETADLTIETAETKQ